MSPNNPCSCWRTIDVVQIKELPEVAFRADPDGQARLWDSSGSVPAMLWSEKFTKNESLIKPDAICFVRGIMNRSHELEYQPAR
jgi:DNA polymerase III subunit alpha